MPMTQMSSEQIFLFSALTEGARAIRSFEEVERLLTIREPISGGERREWLSVFEAIRAALQATANVSKIFWPQPRTAKAVARGERLRALTQLPDNHALAMRHLRNHVEHMDERLDDWTANSPRPFLTFELIIHADMAGNPNEAEIRDAVAIVFVEATRTVELFGESFSLEEIQKNVTDVMDHISAAFAAMHPPASTS